MTVSSLSTVTVGTSSTSFLPAAGDRVAIIVSSPDANRLTLSIDATAADKQGIVLYATNDPLTFTRGSHGDLVTRAWTAIMTTAAATIGVVAVYYP